MSRRPERIVHIGVGAFFRAHQAWYTSQADREGEWGIVGFTGRTATIAKELEPQDCKYHLVTRGPVSDEIELIESLVRIEDGANVANLVETISNPQIALVTLTITEAGYRVGVDGKCDLSDPSVVQDLAALESGNRVQPITALGRLALALDGRRRAGAGPIALVSCDNMPSNGLVVRNVLAEFASRIGPEAEDYFNSQVSYVTTSVDRITPKTTAADIAQVEQATGISDSSPVVTEPFSDWVLSGDFPAGRPNWEASGARFVEDIHSFENRKLWLLNGAHSLLAYSGLLAGYQTVAESISDPVLYGAVEAFWAEACAHLPKEALELEGYKSALLARFANARISHSLRQISNDGATKLRVRIAPTALAELRAGRDAKACAYAIGNWVNWISATEDFVDSQSLAIGQAKASGDPLYNLVSLIEPTLCDYPRFISEIKTTSNRS